jgi:hypothetical protein
LTGGPGPSKKRSDDESDEEASSTNTKNLRKSDSPDVEMEPAINDRKYNFLVGEIVGKYLINYLNLLRHDSTSKKNSFSLFKIKKEPESS